MRYFSYMQTGGERGETYEAETVSEEEIREEYYSHWYSMMCKHYGQEIVDDNWSFEDYLKIWVKEFEAWEVKR